jgi:hypothetical protein
MFSRNSRSSCTPPEALIKVEQILHLFCINRPFNLINFPIDKKNPKCRPRGKYLKANGMSTFSLNCPIGRENKTRKNTQPDLRKNTPEMCKKLIS